jgi:hypothetical protein
MTARLRLLLERPASSVQLAPAVAASYSMWYERIGEPPDALPVRAAMTTSI